MRQRSALRNRVEYGVARAVLFSLAMTPPALAYRLAYGYARLLEAAVPRLRRVALRNLVLALPQLEGNPAQSWHRRLQQPCVAVRQAVRQRRRRHRQGKKHGARGAVFHPVAERGALAHEGPL